MGKFNLEKIFISSLGKPEKLAWFLQYNINLVKYLDAKFVQKMALADFTIALIPKQKIKEEANMITFERILRIIDRERPDLFKIVNTKRGMVWLKNQIDNFKKRFIKD